MRILYLLFIGYLTVLTEILDRNVQNMCSGVIFLRSYKYLFKDSIAKKGRKKV